MIITYHGVQGFKLQQGQTVLGLNVPSPGNSKAQRSRFKCDILLASLAHPDFVSMDLLATEVFGNQERFVISGPGEYEIKEVVVKGFSTPANYGDRTLNTLFLIYWEGMKLGAVGALGQIEDLSVEAREALAEVDILFLPIGGDSVLNAEEAYKLAVKMSPAVIVPCHFKDNGNLDHFLKEGGRESASREEKLTIKKKDLADMTGEIRVLAEQ